MLGEPTNDLDIDTLTVIEDYLDTWPGTLVVVSHDRYFLERTCDAIYALTGDGKCVLLPGGVDEYLERRRRLSIPQPAEGSSQRAARPPASDAAAERQARKELARLEGQLAKLATRVDELHALMSEQAADYERLAALGAELDDALARQDELENRWLDLAERVGDS